MRGTYIFGFCLIGEWRNLIPAKHLLVVGATQTQMFVNTYGVVIAVNTPTYCTTYPCELSITVADKGRLQIPSYIKRLQIPSYIKRLQIPSYIKRLQIPCYIKRLQIPSYIKWFQVPSYIKRLQILSYIKRLQIPSYIKRLQIPSYIKRLQIPSYIKRLQIPCCRVWDEQEQDVW